MNNKPNVLVRFCFLALFLSLAAWGQGTVTNLSVLRLPTSAVLASNAPVLLKFDSQGALYLSGQTSDGGLYTAKYATNGSLVWSQHYADSTPGSVPKAVCLDSTGCFYVTAASASDWVTVKYAADGAPVWTNRVNGTGNGADTPAAITTDSAGNIYVAGSTFVTNVWDAIYLVPTYAATTVSYDALGRQHWRTDDMASPGYGWVGGAALAVAVNNQGQVFVTERSGYIPYADRTGEFSFGISSLSAVNGASTTLQTDFSYLVRPSMQTALAISPSGEPICAALLTAFSPSTSIEFWKFGTNLTLQWSTWPVYTWSYSWDDLVGLAVDPRGNVCLTDFQGGHDDQWNWNKQEMVTYKFAPDGSPIWTNILNGPDHTTVDHPRAMVVDDSGAVIVTGVSTNTDGVAQCVTVKYADDGSLHWTALYGASTNSAPSLDPQAVGLTPQNGWEVAGLASGQSGVGPDILLLTTLPVGTPPSILIPPLSQAVVAGATVTFLVRATGTSSFAYQWQFNGTNLSGATASSLALTNVTPSCAGNYDVVVTNAYGSVTSSVATLTVTIPRTPPQLLAGDGRFGFLTNHQFGFNLSGAFGQNLVVDSSTNLVNWTALFTNTVGNGPFYFLDPASTNRFSQFYRARLLDP